MERKEWLQIVYEAACQVAESHGSGLKEALRSKDDDGALSREVTQVASEVIAGSDDIFNFIRFSRHPEPIRDDWRQAATFEGALIRAAVSALRADINDILDNLASGQAPTFKQMSPSDSGGKPGN